jgi:hypothetical protein
MAATWPMIRRTRFNSLFFSSRVCAIKKFEIPYKNIAEMTLQGYPGGYTLVLERPHRPDQIQRKEAHSCLKLALCCANRQ